MRTLMVVWSVVLLPVIGYAQGGASSASVAGRVVDSTGSVLPGVTVTVTNESTNQARTVVTEVSGSVPGLRPDAEHVYGGRGAAGFRHDSSHGTGPERRRGGRT